MDMASLLRYGKMLNNNNDLKTMGVELMNKYHNKMYEDMYIRNLVGKLAFGIIVFIVSLMWVIVAVGV